MILLDFLYAEANTQPIDGKLYSLVQINFFPKDAIAKRFMYRYRYLSRYPTYSHYEK